MTRSLIVLSVIVLAACGSSERSTGDAGRPPGDAGRVGVDGGPPPMRCPTNPPADGAACDQEGRVCVWVRCEADGEVSATCTAGSWSVATTPCGEFECGLGGGTRCTGDQICVARIGGAFLVDCQANPCGTAAIEESCACEACAGSECTGVTGRTVSCNTCPSGMVCP